MLNVTLNVGEIVLSRKEADKLFDCAEELMKRLRSKDESINLTINIDKMLSEIDQKKITLKVSESLKQATKDSWWQE